MTLTPVEEKELLDFIFLEAQYADESRYDDWESLWSNARDATYWIPRGPDMLDTEKHVSITFDNRERLATRVRQLKTGLRYSQKPSSPMRRVISNWLLRRSEETSDTEGYEVESNFLLMELAVQSTRNINIWAGRTLHKLRREGGVLKIHSKRILLINGDEPLPAISFLI